MKIQYSIQTGTPCEIPSFRTGVSIKAALNDYKSFILESDRIGNTWENSFLTVITDNDERIYEPGPKMGINRIQ